MLKPVLLLMTVFSVSTSPVYGYLDAGTGSIIAQMIIGGIAGFMVMLKLYWYRIKAFFSRSSSETSELDTEIDSD